MRLSRMMMIMMGEMRGKENKINAISKAPFADVHLLVTSADLLPCQAKVKHA